MHKLIGVPRTFGRDCSPIIASVVALRECGCGEKLFNLLPTNVVRMSKTREVLKSNSNVVKHRFVRKEAQNLVKAQFSQYRPTHA